MKNKKKLLIILHVKQESIVPDESGKARDQAIRNFIFKQIILPYGCDHSIRYAPSKETQGITVYYITREGGTKRSITDRIRKSLGLIQSIWPGLIHYDIVPFTEVEGLKQ